MALCFGLSPVAAANGGEAFAKAVGKLVGEPVKLHHTADYRGLISAIENGIVQMAWLPPISAARVIANGKVSPVVVARRSGSTSYFTCLFARKDRGLTDVSQLRGLRAAWVDRESAAGFLVIRAALKALGVKPVDAFREEFFLRSHAAVGLAVAERRADVGATFFCRKEGSLQVDRAGWREAGLADDGVMIIAKAGPIPSDIFAMHSSVSGAYLLDVQRALVDQESSAAHLLAKRLMEADGFVRPEPGHLKLLRTLLSNIDAGIASKVPQPR
ncbi:MAG: hypothetical protein NVSMB1_11140 [Polyangiales bacterium]